MLAVDDLRGEDPRPSLFNLARYVLWDNGAGDDKIALTVLNASGSKRWSYGRLRESVLATGASLLAAGLAPGDRLMLRLGNTTDFPVAFLGAIAAGIIPVPTSPALTEAEITRVAEVIKPAKVLAASGVSVPEGTPIIGMSDLPPAPPLPAPTEANPEDPAYIVVTSGTAGPPIGVIHAHRAILARRYMFDGWYGLNRDDRVLHAGAFNWTYTLGTGLLDPWTAGATALILGASAGPNLLPLLLKRHEATIFAGAPGVFRKLLKTGLPILPKLRHGLSAGEKLAPSLREKWRAATGTDIHEAFGQSECSTFISGAPDRPAPGGALGYTQTGRAVAILGDDGPAERGEIGEIAIHASDPGLMQDYVGDAQPRMTGEWYRTGDMGHMREDGAIVYAGRADDVLTAGGFRISPIEIEEAMATFEALHEAAAVDHRLSDDSVVIALHYAADTPLPERELRAHAERQLAHHKQPRLYVHHPSLPRNPNGKLLRRALRPANGVRS